jgi:hypothetical protein
MIRLVCIIIFVGILSGCSKKDEADLQEMQRKADSIARHEKLNEKLKKYDSLAVFVDSVKKQFDSLK